MRLNILLLAICGSSLKSECVIGLSLEMIRVSIIVSEKLTVPKCIVTNLKKKKEKRKKKQRERD